MTVPVEAGVDDACAGAEPGAGIRGDGGFSAGGGGVDVAATPDFAVDDAASAFGWVSVPLLGAALSAPGCAAPCPAADMLPRVSCRCTV